MANQDELVGRLLKEDEDFKRAYTSHREYERKVSEMERKAHLTADESIEKKRLKKLKLALKDEMEKIIARHRG